MQYQEVSSVLSRIFRLGEKFRVVEGHKFLRGSGGIPPRKLFEKKNMR